MKRILFLASGGGGTLKFIHRVSEIFSEMSIVGVVADRHCGAIDFAEANGVSNRVIDCNINNQDKLSELIVSYTPDIVVTNIHKILCNDVISLPNIEFINLHYSLLPAFNGLIGMQTVNLAKKSNVQFIGSTVHKVTEVLDGGDILSQGVVNVDWSRAIDDIYQDVFEIGCICLLNTILSSKTIHSYSYKQFVFSPKLSFDASFASIDFWKTIK